ncbi:hypothetical protein [Shouchella shacheensis]|uniref:hypothetical protein n=1 Tax=Shouchella shacheensis TaxID=1649580 RepID=UPI0007401DE6|nr:hypothetical protein [Shouchella shacheensis]
MSIKKFKIVNANETLSSALKSESKKLVRHINKETNPKRTEAVLVNDTVLITGKNVSPTSKVYITNPRTLKDFTEEFEQDLQGPIRQLKKGIRFKSNSDASPHKKLQSRDENLE